MKQKQCSKCKQWKDEEEFPWHIKFVKRHSSCRDCRKLYQDGYYQRTKEIQAVQKANRREEKREAARHYVFTYLQSHSCEMCGETDPYVLTFHHIRGRKKMNISQMINQGYSLEVLQEEMHKCQILCANCHMRVEKKRRGTNYWIF